MVTWPAQLGAVGDDDVVTDVAVVRQVHVGHDEAAGADRGAVALRGAAVDRGVLADDRAGADLDPGLLAAILEILRIAAEDRPVADAARPSASRTFRSSATRGPRRQRSPTVTWGPTMAHGPISTSAPEPAPGIDDGRRVDDAWSPVHHARHHLGLRHDVAVHVGDRPSSGRCGRGSAASRARSAAGRPGTTGRRNFTLSSDMK